MIKPSSDLPQTQILISHARARLLVGMIGVGAIVCACFIGLMAFSLTNATCKDLRADLPIISILLLYLFYLVLQSTADICGGVIIPLVFQKQSEGVLQLVRHLCLGAIRHGVLNIATLGTLVSGSILFGRLGLLIAGVVNIAVLLLFQRYLFQLVSWTKLEKTHEKITLVSSGLDSGFTGAVVDSINGTILLLPFTAIGVDYEYKTLRLKALRVLQSKSTRIILSTLTNSFGCIMALYYLSHYQSLPVRDVILYSLCTTLWSFALLIVLPVLNRQAVFSIDRELIDSGLKYSEFERAVRIEDSRGEDEYSRSTLVQSVFYPIPAPETRLKQVTTTLRFSRFWIAFHQIARRSLYASLGCGGFLSRSVHCNVGRPELWIIAPSD